MTPEDLSDNSAVVSALLLPCLGEGSTPRALSLEEHAPPHPCSLQTSAQASRGAVGGTEQVEPVLPTCQGACCWARPGAQSKTNSRRNHFSKEQLVQAVETWRAELQSSPVPAGTSAVHTQKLEAHLENGMKRSNPGEGPALCHRLIPSSTCLLWLSLVGTDREEGLTQIQL